MKKPEKIITVLMVMVLSLVGAYSASAQEIVVPEGYELVDSLVYRHVSGVDTLLIGKDVFHVMPLKSRGG